MEIPVWAPSISKKEKNAILEAMDIGYLGMGKTVFDFEEAVANELGVNKENIVSTHTGQSALHTIFETFLEDGNNISLVISPSMNNVADFHAVVNSNLDLYFVDCDENKGTINVESIPHEILEKAQAIIILDYASAFVDISEISKLCSKFGLFLIYDAAHSFGSINFERLKFADAVMFSFDPIKTFTAIDGGIIYWRDVKKAKISREIRHMGMGQDLSALKNNKRSNRYDVNTKGYRYHLSNIHAACGIEQIKRKDEISKKRLYASNKLREELLDIKSIENWVPIDKGFLPFMNVCFIKPGLKDLFISKLSVKGIQCGVHWTPGHYFTKFKKIPRSSLIGTENFFQKIVSLPLFTDITDQQIEYIVDSIKEIDHSIYS